MGIVTHYKGVSKIYFDTIISNIIRIGNLETKNLILDYGCGEKRVQKKLKKKILNYDINPNYTDYNKIDNLHFKIVILNQVLMYLPLEEIYKLFKKFYSINPKIEFIIGMGKQNLISKILAILSFNPNAHTGTKISYSDQKKFINENFDIIASKENIFFMADIFYVKFKKNIVISML